MANLKRKIKKILIDISLLTLFLVAAITFFQCLDHRNVENKIKSKNQTLSTMPSIHTNEIELDSFRSSQQKNVSNAVESEIMPLEMELIENKSLEPSYNHTIIQNQSLEPDLNLCNIQTEYMPQENSPISPLNIDQNEISDTDSSDQLIGTSTPEHSNDVQFRRNTGFGTENNSIISADFNAIFEENKIVVNGVFKNRDVKKSYFKPKPIKFPELNLSEDFLRSIEEYLKQSYSEKNDNSDAFINEESIKDHIKNIEIPENIRKEVINLNFKYRLVPDDRKGYFVTRSTWDKIVSNVEDVFIKKIISLIKTVTFSEIPEDYNEKEMSNYLSIYKNEEEIYEPNLLDENSIFLDLREVEFYESEIKIYIEKKRQLNIFEQKISDNFNLILCEDRIEQINNYLESCGLIIPEELIDPITAKLIYKPVLCNPYDNMFFDISTFEKLLHSGHKVNPFTRRPFLFNFEMTEIEGHISSDKIKNEKDKIRIFLDKIGERLEKFYIKNSNDYIKNYKLG